MNILEVKDKHGVIKDSVRETIADLVGIENVPAKSSFRIFKKCATLAGKEVVGSWDRRSVPRIMHEAAQATEILIVERILESIGSSSIRGSACDGGAALNFLDRTDLEWGRLHAQQYPVFCSTHHDSPR